MISFLLQILCHTFLLPLINMIIQHIVLLDILNQRVSHIHAPRLLRSRTWLEPLLSRTWKNS